MTLVKWKRPSSNGQVNNSLIYREPAEHLFTDFFPEGIIGPGPYFRPAANITDDEKEYGIELAVPGFEKTDLRIELQEQTLIVSGAFQEKKENGTQLLGFRRQSFRREFTLPDHILEDDIKATYLNGILHIRIPKDQAGHAKTIAIS